MLVSKTKKYDYLIIGSGLFGAVFAHQATRHGRKVLVIDKRNHLGGNIYCEKIADINIHKYGPHIFHTNNKFVWDFVTSLVGFNDYVHMPLANYNDKLYPLPFNMHTFHELWGITTPQEARQKIEEQRLNIINPKNLEEQALMLVGKDIYEKLIKGYTEKQWGRKCIDLPASILQRIPVRFTFDNNYYDDRYQGIPIGGYNKLTEKLLAGIEIKTNCDFFTEHRNLESLAEKIIYTGEIDRYYDYQFGKLEYRSLYWETEILNRQDFQSNAQINYTSVKIPYSRIIEHKHFEFGTQPQTIISREYPAEWQADAEPFYPINDTKNTLLYNKYFELALKEKNVIFGGRLAEYKYYDMDEVIERAFFVSQQEIKKC